MPKAEMMRLMEELARLLSRRSSTPRGEALGIAHRKIREYAEDRGLDEEWCDEVLLMFISPDSYVSEAA